MNAELISLEGWDIASGAHTEWVDWGGTGAAARAKVLSAADGYTMVLVEAGAGYRGTPHVHAHPEFVYVLDGELRNQGRRMVAGDAYAAATGSSHDDFSTDAGATYVLIFKL
jgi:quercetin dioxygenase-like cupin family protein